MLKSLRQYIGQWDDGYVSDEDMMKKLFKWASSPAGGSLARRDLIKQAEAMEELCQSMDKDWDGNVCIYPETITAKYEELRQQAEGHQ